jgi:hypothetical protein
MTSISHQHISKIKHTFNSNLRVVFEVEWKSEIYNPFCIIQIRVCRLSQKKNHTFSFILRPDIFEIIYSKLKLKETRCVSCC